MRKVVLWGMIAAVLLLAACGAQTDSLGFAFDADGNYTGFESIPVDLSQEEMVEKGYVVRSELDTVANEDVWTHFVEAAGEGEDAGVRIVTLADERPCYTDLFYEDGDYYLFDSTADTNFKEPFKYLLSLEGQTGNPKRDTVVVVLTDEGELTFEDVIESMISSYYDPDRPAYRLVMFL